MQTPPRRAVRAPSCVSLLLRPFRECSEDRESAAGSSEALCKTESNRPPVSRGVHRSFGKRPRRPRREGKSRDTPRIVAPGDVGTLRRCTLCGYALCVQVHSVSVLAHLKHQAGQSYQTFTTRRQRAFFAAFFAPSVALIKTWPNRCHRRAAGPRGHGAMGLPAASAFGTATKRGPLLLMHGRQRSTVAATAAALCTTLQLTLARPAAVCSARHYEQDGFKAASRPIQGLFKAYSRPIQGRPSDPGH